MRRAIVISSLLLLMTSDGTVKSQETGPVKKLMSLKLDHARTILESIIKQDFETLKESSFRLGVLTASSDWLVIPTPEYSQNMADFRRAVEALGETHKGGDIDSAALAYLDMTLRCVQCHKYVRAYQTGSEETK